jgi:predicted N-acetyltransferase YhbS
MDTIARNSTLTIQREQGLSVDEVTEVLRASTLGERRPIDDPAIVAEMLRHGNLMIAARVDGTLIGFARTLTDFLYVGYLSDLAVVSAYQRQGIGRRLIDETRRHMGPRSMLVLLAAPAAHDYYAKVGFEQHHSAWIRRAAPPPDSHAQS